MQGNLDLMKTTKRALFPRNTASFFFNFEDLCHYFQVRIKIFLKERWNWYFMGQISDLMFYMQCLVPDLHFYEPYFPRNPVCSFYHI